MFVNNVENEIILLLRKMNEQQRQEILNFARLLTKDGFSSILPFYEMPKMQKNLSFTGSISSSFSEEMLPVKKLENKPISKALTLDEKQAQFLDRYREYGFKDKSEVLITALQRLQSELEAKELQESAELYAEIYQEDRELQELTESALEGWPQD